MNISKGNVSGRQRPSQTQPLLVDPMAMNHSWANYSLAGSYTT